MERVTGFEPVPIAWKAIVLAINTTPANIILVRLSELLGYFYLTFEKALYSVFGRQYLNSPIFLSLSKH